MLNSARLSFALAVGLVLSPVAVLAAAPDELMPPNLKPTAQQQQLTLEVLQRLGTRHYHKVPVDDALSERLFNSYLAALDGTRIVFRQQDIQALGHHRTRLDNALQRGDISAAFAIFNHYRSRAWRWLNEELLNLDDNLRTLDFKPQEYLSGDASEQPWAADDAELAHRRKQHLQHRLLTLIMADESTATRSAKLREQFTVQRQRLQEIKAQDVVNIFFNSLTQLYDSHTNYMSPRSTENFRIAMSLSLEGIGATLRRRDRYTEVVELVEGGPAALQGELRPGDRIIAVAQGTKAAFEEVVGWRLDDVVSRIRGERGSVVRLRLLASGATLEATTGTRVVAITRDSVKLESQAVSSEVISLSHSSTTRRVAVLKVPSFYLDFRAYERGAKDYRSTTRDVLQRLSELRLRSGESDTEGVEGLIIDLRNNGGGSLQEANALTGLFIQQGPVVQVRQSNEHILRQGKIRRGPYYDWPMVVLINRLSASAAEIFAAAIQDYGRALILGGRSYGKGTVQTLQRLSAGQIKLTDAKFYRISGGSTQLHGVLPDVLFPSRYDPQTVGESSLDNAMIWDRIASVRHHRYNDMQDYLPELQRRHEMRTAQQPEFQFLRQQLATREQHRQQDKRIPLWGDGRRQLYKQRQKDRQLLEELRQYDAEAKPLLDESAHILLDFIELQRVASVRSAVVSPAQGGIPARR